LAFIKTKVYFKTNTQHRNQKRLAAIIHIVFERNTIQLLVSVSLLFAFGVSLSKEAILTKEHSLALSHGDICVQDSWPSKQLDPSNLAIEGRSAVKKGASRG